MAESDSAIRLTPADASAVAGVLYRAFDADPLWSYVVPPSTTRATELRRFWQGAATYTLACGEVYATREIDGVACWLPPGQTDVTLRQMIRSRFALQLAVMRLGPVARQRALDLVGYIDSLHKRLLDEPHWYLFALAVNPESQGRGIGGRLIEPVLARADRHGHPCYLETQAERNVAFYARRGFEVVHEGEVPKHPLTVWAMLRKPRS